MWDSQGGVSSSKLGYNKGAVLGTPKREPQEYRRNIMEHKDHGRYIPVIFLPYSWGSLFGVPSKALLHKLGERL